jgi:hypothetical protein
MTFFLWVILFTVLLTKTYARNGFNGWSLYAKKYLWYFHRGTSNVREVGYTYYISGEHTPMS